MTSGQYWLMRPEQCLKDELLNIPKSWGARAAGLMVVGAHMLCGWSKLHDKCWGRSANTLAIVFFIPCDDAAEVVQYSGWCS
uniref:Uncharacterized protein n=1 Tax=Rhizophora mucronata TaxID=61149 RepID=A0A2P2JH85_RHIMU